MKKIIFISIIAVVLASCATYKSLDLGKLTTGMTKAEVEAAIGKPARILAVNDKKEGYQEVLEYRTAYDEVYALEFWNDYLTGYEFLYDDVNYVASVAPPTIWPVYGRPIYIISGNHNSSRPNRPSQPSRPTPPSRPETSKPSLTKPSPGVGPSTRPSYNHSTGSSSTRPTTDRSKLAR